MVDEKKLLLSLLEEIDSKKIRIFMRPWFNYLIWISTTLIVIGVRYLLDQGFVYVSIIFAMLSGVALGLTLYLQHSEKIWSYIKNHIDKDSINKRIDEIKT